MDAGGALIASAQWRLDVHNKEIEGEPAAHGGPASRRQAARCTEAGPRKVRGLSGSHGWEAVKTPAAACLG